MTPVTFRSHQDDGTAFGIASVTLGTLQLGDRLTCAAWDFCEPIAPSSCTVLMKLLSFFIALTIFVLVATFQPASAPAQTNCEPAYPDFCITPSLPNLDCADVSSQNFTVLTLTDLIEIEMALAVSVSSASNLCPTGYIALSAVDR